MKVMDMLKCFDELDQIKKDRIYLEFETSNEEDNPSS